MYCRIDLPRAWRNGSSSIPKSRRSCETVVACMPTEPRGVLSRRSR
jgi:hypothetical protein